MAETVIGGKCLGSARWLEDGCRLRREPVTPMLDGTPNQQGRKDQYDQKLFLAREHIC